MHTNVKIGLAVAALLIGLPIGCSLINATNAVATAPGRVVTKTMQTDNIIDSYATFFDTKASYDARLGQIADHKALIAGNSDPSEASRLRIELAAMRQSCRELAAGYNADAGRADKKIFQSRDLPATLSEETCNA